MKTRAVSWVFNSAVVLTCMYCSLISLSKLIELMSNFTVI